jgi:putative sterol carrier protein
MDLNSRDEVWAFIKGVIESIQNDPAAQALIPEKKGVNVTTNITDLDIVYTEKIGFGKYELLEGKTEDTEVTLSLNSDTHYKIQMGEVNPMACAVNNKLVIDGIPFKLLKGQKINDEFKRVYKEKMNASK